MLRFLSLLYTRTQGEPGRTTSAQSDATKALKAFKHIPLNSYDFQSSSPSAISVFRNNSPFYFFIHLLKANQRELRLHSQTLLRP